MSTLPPLTLTDFTAFFRAVHGHDPFPWQARLAQQVAESGWPAVLDLPTGTGKTAALDVAVFALALEAGRAPRTAPLRIVFVVDRRTIVDQAHERARAIQQALVEEQAEVVSRVRQRLAQYSDTGTPLLTALLRGGMARDEAWARTPDQPLIAVSTVDQVGSRLLFRGYGVSDAMKPVHAGLLGNDVLYLLDEVHLSQPFRETLVAIRDRYRQWADRPVPGPFTVVEMSATPGAVRTDTFRLEEADRRHPVLAMRLQASKPVSLVSTHAKGFVTAIETHVRSMLDRPGATVAVVVNRVKAAREIHERLCQIVPGASGAVHLLTGRMRPVDRSALERTLLTRIRAGRTRRPDDAPVVVVATQSIEAGADVDVDGLITECASLDALRQRFGRLDRIGALGRSARGVIVARTDALTDDPVYDDAIGKTWDWLRTSAAERPLDFGIEALHVPEDAEERGLLSPKAHAPVLLPSHLDAWVQTAPLPDPDPDVALWLHGPERGVADVQVVWRVDVSDELLRHAADAGRDGEETAEVAIGMVEAIPPVSAEAMSVSFLAAKRWLEGRAEAESFDVEGARDREDERPDHRRLKPSRAFIIWQGDQSRVARADALRPGQTIVVPASYGGVASDNWAPASEAPVRDVAEVAALRTGRRPTLRLHEAVVRALFGPHVKVPRPQASESETRNDREVVVGWLERVAADRAAWQSDVSDLIDRLRREATSLRIERLPSASGEQGGEYFVVAGRRRPHPVQAGSPTSVDDQVVSDACRSSLTGATVTLREHQAGVAATVSGFAARLGLPDALAADLRVAAEWHDAGKADPRFQRWLHGGSECKALVQPEPLAKGMGRLTSRTAMRLARERAGYPPGGRHELMSVVLMESAAPPLAVRARDWPLVLHVVASHHGHCRPFAPWVPDLHPVDVTFSGEGIRGTASSAHDLARLDSGVAERFWQMVRRYGWWGLAGIEALLRLADHWQSEREQASGGARRA